MRDTTNFPELLVSPGELLYVVRADVRIFVQWDPAGATSFASVMERGDPG
jgi:hypothetical protein